MNAITLEELVAIAEAVEEGRDQRRIVRFRDAGIERAELADIRRTIVRRQLHARHHQLRLRIRAGVKFAVLAADENRNRRPRGPAHDFAGLGGGQWHDVRRRVDGRRWGREHDDVVLEYHDEADDVDHDGKKNWHDNDADGEESPCRRTKRIRKLGRRARFLALDGEGLEIAGAGQVPLYLTFDIDCLDPAYAPGTGTPEPGGLSSSQALTLLEELRDLNWVGMDLCEVAPPYDHAELTSNAAATLIWTYLCGRLAAR